MKDKKTDIYSIIIGLVFIVSGVSKSLDSATFSQTINLYGFENIGFLSPIIIIVEICLGLALLFKIQIKKISFLSLVFLICLTLTFLYGWIFKDITDCGCFGKINFLNSSPIFTIAKNAVLIYLCIDLWLSSDKEALNEKWFTSIIFLLTISIACFMCGYTFKSNKVSKKKKANNKIAVSDSKISSFTTLSPDSTYLVFAFSYSCPHCMNSIENLKQYEKSGIVNKVIGIAVDDNNRGDTFMELFTPNFEIIEVSKREITEITSSLPKSFYIHNDSIQFTLSGALPSAYVLKDALEKRKK